VSRPQAVACAALAASATAVGCGGSSGDKPPPPPARLGCHQYCRQTGGFGAPPTSPPPMSVVANRRPVRVANGVLPVSVQCRFVRRCTGAILVTLDTTELGRSDLIVDAHRTRTIGVPVTAAGRKALARIARTKVLVSLDTGPSWMTLPQAQRPHWGAVQPGYVTVTAPRSR
jgi:hypothetical protein